MILPDILRLTASSNLQIEDMRKRLDRLEYDMHRQHDNIDKKLDQILAAVALGNTELTMETMQQATDKHINMIQKLFRKVSALEQDIQKVKQQPTAVDSADELEQRIGKLKKEICI